jgi:beta-lactamase regulating signal transducer with metallopeptidase domain
MYILSLEQWVSTVFVKALGLTFLHSLWQGLLALVLCHMVLGLAKKWPPQVRYVSLLSIASALLCTICVTFAMQLQYAGVSEDAAATYRSFSNLVDTSNRVTAPVIAEWQRVLPLIGGFLNDHADVIITLWFVVFIYKSLRLSLSVSYVKRITEYGSEPVNGEWKELFLSVKQKMNVLPAVTLLQSHLINMPMTAGFFKPVIVLPVSMLANLSADMVESILLHELAHIRRRDYFVHLLQSFAESIFFFNPFVIKISSLIKDEREACCDRMAVEVVKNKVTYVNALVAFGEYATKPAESALAFAGNRYHLLNRVKRILFNQNKKLGVMEKSILACCLVVLLGVAIFSTAKGTEQKLKTGFVSHLGSFVADTIPAEQQQQQRNRREERKARKRSERSASSEKSAHSQQRITQEEQHELEQALREVKAERDRLKQELYDVLEMRKESLEREIQELQREVENDINIQHVQQLAQKKAIIAAKTLDAQKQIQLIKAQEINKELQAVLANTQVQLKNAITLKTKEQKVALEKYLNDSVVTRLKFLNVNLDNNVITEILHFLEQNGVAKAKDIKSFSLDGNSLHVNDEEQSTDLHRQLKEKYLGRQGDHINYNRSGNSTSISIQRNDREENGND